MKPWRSREYRNAGIGYPCVNLCGRPATDPAHVRLIGACGTSQKPADYLVMDLCRTCHDAYDARTRPDWHGGFERVLLCLSRTWKRRVELGFFGDME